MSRDERGEYTSAGNGKLCRNRKITIPSKEKKERKKMRKLIIINNCCKLNNDNVKVYKRAKTKSFFKDERD